MLDCRTDAIDLTIQFCLKDIHMFPKYVKTMQTEFGCIPRITTFQRLATLYEKAGQYKEAIEICNLAIKYGLSVSVKPNHDLR